VIAPGLELTYGELAARANALGRRIRDLGAKPNELVAVVMEKGWEQVVGVLAVLAAGAAYLPIDPDLPRARRFLLFANAGVRVALTQPHLAEKLEWPEEMARLVVAREDSPSAEEARPFPAVQGAADLAYVIYTSGSTGNPKGVMIDHRGALNTVVDVNERYGVTAEDRVLALSSLSFDLSVYDVFGLLAVGGAVVLPEAGKSRDPQHWAELVDRHGVTLWDTVPALMEMLVDYGEVTGYRAPSLRLVMMSGDWIPLRLPERIRQLSPGVTVYSMGGATEASIWSIFFPIGEIDPSWRSVPYGRAMRNQTFHVLDKDLLHRPVGVPGNLYIGGIGLALGYWGDAEKTASSFLTDPWTGERLYRTGDLGRYFPDGNIEFLGREDFQVKVGGFRIELGEIEAALSRHPGIREALALAVAGERGGRRLIAYVVPALEAAPDAGELRAFLGDQLPAYMVPADFVFLEAFPLTSNGKVDRQALPVPEGGPEAVESAFTPPSGLVEEMLAGFFREVLRLDRVGAGDDFFELGGNSLLATQVTSRLRAGFNVDLPLRTVFEKPRLGELARAIEQRMTEGSAAAEPLLPRPADAPPAALSFAQQRLWFLDQLEPGSAMYNLPVAVRLTGDLDRTALAAALTEIVRRHQVLRTTYRVDAGLPVQVVGPLPAVPLPVVDLAGLPAAAREGEAARLGRDGARRPFDLARDPMIRVALLALGAAEHLALVTQHHIASDGWSIGVLLRELGALYAAAREGRPSPLPEPGIQYADFAVWQRRRLSGERLAALLGFWRRQLADAPPALELPVDRPYKAVDAPRGTMRYFSLPAEARAALAVLSRRSGVTPFMSLLAVFALLLRRYGGQDDVVIGTPVAGRGRMETEELIGLFVSTLAARVDLAGDPSAGALLDRVRETMLGAFAHQEMPFEKLVEELAPERDLRRPPLVQAMLVLQNTPAETLALPGLELQATALPTGTAMFELTLTFAGAGDDLTGAIEYSRELFDGATIQRLTDGFGRLLAAAGAAPEAPISELPLLGAAELHQTLAEWSDRARVWGFGEDVGLAQLCEAQAARTPDAPAVLQGEETLTYAELHRRANRLAHRLRRMGVGPDRRVGLLLERSPEAVVALLAVLKAGGAYVPLDPSFPADRLAWMMEDSGLAVLLAEERAAAKLPAATAFPVLRLDAEREVLAGESAEALPPVTLADNLAYVIYTSGSTGRPKGVAVTQRGIVSFLAAMREEPGMTPEDVLLAVATLSFDISGLDVFLPLLTGARVVIARPEEAAEGGALARRIAESGATVLQATPATWQMLLDGGEADLGRIMGRLTGLCGGEALDPAVAATLVARTRAFWNLYGPTETTVWATARRLDGGAGPIPIGRPIANVRAVLFDRDGRPAAPGAVGHLCIGGVGLARGYLGRPDLTAERFVPDPLAPAPGARLYRTGDLARFLPDGTLEYLGRADRQVKLRGFRIELGEIEAVLRQAPGVREAAVVLVEGGLQERHLAAYVVGGAGAEDLRRFLQGRLPGYMVPATFTALPALPLSPTGKVDRKALAALAPRPTAAETGRSPRTPAERALAEIYAAVLKLPAVGADADFFALGGHSLLATQVISRLRAFGVELPMRTFFEKPVLADLAAHLAPELAAAPEPAVVPEPPRPPAPAIPLPPAEGSTLSFAQQRLWFLDQMDPGSAVYNIPMRVELRGRLDVAVLAAAFREVVRRHAALRTTFHKQDGQPVQAVADRPALELPVIDLRALGGKERRREVGRLELAEARRPFDLARGPLARATLLRLGAMQHKALVTLHHIVSDGWSMGVMVREVGALYAAFLAGASSPLPELAMQYPEYAARQRQRLSGEHLAAELAWWREQLAGMPPALELPTDHPRPPALSGRGREHVFAVKAEGFAALNAFARRQGATLFMALLSGFLGLLQRHTGEDDLVVGTPIAGRTRVELEPLIGLFVNTLALRTDLSGDPDVATLVERVRETTLSAYAHQEVPFERLVEELAPERDLSRPPLVQVLFVVQNAPMGALELPGLELQAADQETGTTKVELTCTLTEKGSGLEGILQYSADLFEAATVERLAGHLTRLLAGAVADPARRLSELPLLSDGERGQLLGWNAAAAEPVAATPVTLFEAQVRRDPEAPALTFEDETLTYGELNRRANRLAWHLRGLGVGPETRVGVLLDRSLEQVVGLLGILKAGGAYVPFDPSAPLQRLEYLCADSGVRALVTDDREELPPLPEAAAVVRLGGDEEEREEDDDLPALARPDNLCYVIYTSGSTGQPKGVLVSHGNVARLLSATERWFHFGPDDVWTLFHSYSFDFSVWELWGALAYGGRLVVVPYWVSRSPEAFWWLLAEEKVTVLNQTPSAFRQLVQADGERTPAERRGLALRWVVFGGEALDLAALAPWYARHAEDAPRLVNMYGITETTVHVSYRPLAAADLAQAHRSPIGIAIPDLGLRVLDAHLHLVPLGVTGEICVGGAGLARGYLGRPELTAERFVPDPFSPRPGERLYRSGDLARYRPDGELEYLGRRDHQVKVRGFRIELGEIEAALLAQEGVKTAVVLPRRDASGATSLVAYVQAARALSWDRLRERLRGRLPDYMIPSAALFLEALPLTVNGKLDRKALLALPLEPVASAAVVDAPRTPTEERVAAIFAEVLSLARVGATADFFALGGHSLLATQVVSRVQAVFGIELAVRAVFEAPTVAALAARIDGQLADQPGTTALPAVPRVPRDGRLEPSFAQRRLWFLDQLEPGTPAYNIPVALELRGRLDEAALRAALGEAVRRHEALRTTFRAVAGEPEQVIAPPAPPVLPAIDLRSLSAARGEAEALRLAFDEARRPFDLARGPLLRAALAKVEDERHLVLLTMHHIVSDAWSIGTLVREIGALYAAFLAGVPSPLPEPAIQYADFAAWQRHHLSEEHLESEIAWWHERLAGLPVLELPTDHPRPATQSLRGAGHAFTLPVAGLAGLSRGNGATTFMTLLAGFLALLQRYTGNDDLAVGTPIAGRTRVETEPLIGLFINTLVLRGDLAGDPDIVALLARVREVTLSAYAHQEIPFERLVEDLAPERDLSRTPLVQVMFSLQAALADTLELPGLTLSTTGPGTGTAKFELTCALTEQGEVVAGVFEYNRDLFEPATISRMAGHFANLLAGMAADPAGRLSDLSLLSPDERRQILDGWNETAAAPLPTATALELFLRRAAEGPERPAVVEGTRVTTYGDLLRRSERLAAWLARQGVGAEDAVALVAPRGADLVAATVGVARSGAAFLPLDPAYPAPRLQALLRGSGARLALVAPGIEIPDAGLPLVSIAGDAWRDETAEAPARPPAPEQLAYGIYTSGSTGEPKGVMVSHAALRNLVAWHLRAHGLTAADRCTLVASPAFDAAVWELWPALCAGAALRVVDEETRLAPARLLGLLAADGTTVAFLPTPLAERVLELAPPAGLALRALLTGGDRLRRVPAGLPYAVGNHYGPTEAAVVSTWTWAVPGTDLPPIGRPVDATRAYVLDRLGRPLPAGVPGELCVAGASLARGYLGRPDLTADAFRPDPFGAPGARRYHTGDLARWSADGELEFLGRVDHQVKVRGVRIEPAEIEAALTRHPAVREAAVLVLDDPSGDRRLTAFVVPAADRSTGDLPAELRSALRRSLPDVMIPAEIVPLESLPLTANGKRDRAALARLGRQAASAGRASGFTAPQGPVEEMLAEIWAEALGSALQGRVGARDDFFSLGGHSLLATRVISRVRETFQVELPLRALFEAPTVEELAARIASEGGAPSLPPIVPLPRAGDPPLSFAQQRLWFLDRLAPDNPFYNLYGAVRLTGALDVPALERAFQEIVGRHETLRTTFRLVAGRPVQSIAAELPFSVPVIDLSGVTGGGGELQRLSAEETGRPFDLARGPLIRAFLFRLGAGEHTLLLNLHHVISDGWSMGVLFSELAALYAAFVERRPSPLPPLPIQYADFALWQREHLSGERLAAELDYWRRQLAGAPEALDLPLDHPRPAVESFLGGVQSFEIGSELVRGLTALTRRGGATLSMTLLTGFAALLGRYAGRDDVPVGVAIANRTRREVEGLIGFFVNTLVVRADLAGSPGFEEALGRVRETSLSAYAHQDLPFERLVEELAPERDLGRNPLIQVMFGYQSFPRAEVRLPGLTLSPPEEGQPAGRTAKFDLTMFLFEEGDRLAGLIEYNRELFEPSTVRRLLGHFERLLAAAVAEPAAAVDRLPLLSAAERHQARHEWNDTASAYPAEASLQALFEAQVRRDPDAVALLHGDDRLSYGELNRRANRLAARLFALGVGPDERVGLCIERSPEMVVGVLGILKAGGAYVPLDPDYPAERLAFMTADARLRVLVAGEKALGLLPPTLIAGLDVVLLEAGDLGALDANPPVSAQGGSLAYVMYTSGSTGRPKGVEVPHRAVTRLVRETGYADFGPQQVFLQFAPISFDASTLELWGPLLNGGRLVLAPPHSLSLEELGEILERYGVTTLWLTAGLFHQFAEHRLELLRPVRQLLAGGDALSVPHVRRVLAGLPETRLINGYGPTESTTFTCCYPMQGARLFEASVPLGRPIANTVVHLLDRHGAPVPVGVAGELCAGGDGLSRGYLGRPELTAERFVPDPSGEGRLYRTGDLARHLPDGRVEFLGRIDQQVKIRGFRIEPGEIESRLGEHPGIRQAVVTAREDVPGDRSLVAYVVPSPSYEPPAAEGPEHASQWEEIFDDLYREEAAGADPTFNIIGWNSTYTGQPLPAGEMEEWLRDTIGRISALAPRRVLEIGCGTGMILFRIAPGCELYTGTDVSARALGYVEHQLGRAAALGIDRSRVRLLQRPADRLEGLEEEGYDTVILNSVAQYFPSAEALAEVIAGAVAVMRPGGALFLGDLRSLPLLPAFHASLELFQAEPGMSVPRLRQKVQARRMLENELVVDPAFFAALRRRLPRIARVEVHPKRGRAHNELTGFRYQVVLRLGETPEPAGISWLDWSSEGLTLATLRSRLETEAPALLGLRGVPNARVAEAAAALRLLRDAEAEGIATAADLRRRAAEAAAGAVEPQDLWDLGRELPYEIEVGWASPGAAGGFDAVLRRRGAGAPAPLASLLPEPEADVEDLSRCANDPLQGQVARRLAPELRAFLKERLPEHMVPAAFVVLDAFPLSPNGKVERRLLPAPEAARPEGGESFVAPRDATEERLAAIWRQLLGADRVGIHDDFFELGGHSLLATQAVSRVREELGVELPLRAFFEAPTVAAVAEAVAALRLQDAAAEAPPIVPVPRSGRLPLSFAQERLWFLDRLDTRALAYNESAAFRMEGPLAAAALRWSLDELLRRHESLRTTFPEIDGEAVQAIQPPAPFALVEADLTALPAAAREEAARELATAQARRPFDLARGPLVRGLLARLGTADHALFVSFHHIVFDGWSTGIFVRELSALYGARVAGEPSPLPPLPVQYADFAAWQRSWLRGAPLERQLAYWRERLAGIVPLGLATDRPRPLLPEAPSGLRYVALPPALTQGLRDLSRAHGVTLFMTLLAGFQALLHRYTGQDDVAVGSPIANRERGEVEGLIGFFVNMLVLRADLSGDPGFAELLERVRQVALGAYAHQGLPFEKLVEELRPDRDLRRTPLFQVSFQLLNVPASTLDLAGLALRPVGFAARSAKFDVELALVDAGEALTGLLDYDADLFDAATLERLLAHLATLLAGAVAHPEARLSELPLLTRPERAQLVAEWNDTNALFPAAGARLHELFEAQARRAPEAVALVFEGEELGYRELDARANRLARALRRRGVETGTRVGLCVERSLEMVVALLGVLKAGGAYVPLDPGYPAERLAFMLEDARVPVLLTQERLLPILPEGAGGVLCLDSQWDEVAGESAEGLGLPFDADDLAYVIYTSGSTGRPKGVMNSHRGIVNRLLWVQAADPLTAEDRVLQKTPFSFDVSVWEFFWPLVTGARLVLARPGGHLDPGYLVELIREAGVTTAHFVPSLLEAFVDAAEVESCTSLRRVICSGEALGAALAHRFVSRFPAGGAPALHNFYGPTEAAVEVTAWRYDPASPLAAVPIGRPVANTWALVLDESLQPVPVGVPGELFLGGVQLARGYLGRPDLTAERFVPDPFAAPGEGGSRLYRTGDQVRRQPGGEIVYLGRLDHQVKLRGVRIEMGEVEAALASLPEAGKSVVVAREDVPGDPRLVAYLTGEAPADELRRRLRERLPEAMVPSAFVYLDALPLTPSGKVDRKALPAPDRGLAPELVAPRTAVEEALAEIWAEVLGVERVGVHDSFFELGGHSLLAVVLMARIEKRLGKTFPLATLFSAPTVAALAALVDRAGGPARRSPLVAVQPRGERAPFFCVHPIGGNVLCYLDLSRQLGPEQPFYAFQTPDPGEGGALSASVEEMAARYLRDLRRVQPRGPYRLGGWSMGGLVAFEMARQLAAAGETVDLLALIDTPPPAAQPPVSEEEVAAGFAHDLSRLLGYDGGALPPDLGPDELRPLFDMFAANLRASRAYDPQPYAGSLTLALSERTAAEREEEILAGWRRRAGGVEPVRLPGDHYSLLRRPGVERLAAELAARLAVGRLVG
jgi:amino acid adenylation domain-containing protein